MNIEVSQSELLRALAAADGIAKPSTMPLLECVLITANGESVLVEATDLSMTISAELESAKCIKRGTIVINAKRLRDVVKNAPGGNMTISALDNAYVDIKCGKAHYKIAGVPGRDFPKIAKPLEGSIATAVFDGGQLKQMIDRTLFSASDDASRVALNGALFSAANGTASMVTTDGHRLSRATCSSEATFSAIVPKEALAKLARIIDVDAEVGITIVTGRIFVRSGGIVMSSGLIDMAYPPIDQVIPKEFTHQIVVDRVSLIASIERTRIATSETRGMKIDGHEGRLVMSSSNPDVGEVSDEVATTGITKALRSCLAPKYMLEPLARFTDDEVTLKFSGELAPMIIESANSAEYMALVMQMRRD